jgi:hypothetical protein
MYCRSVNNVIRTLLIQASLPGRYWTEGLHTATYLLNRLPTTAIQAACPHLALFGSAPSYEHLRFFGCTCYPNTTVTAPHKLSPRSTRCIFLSYSADNKGYRVVQLPRLHHVRPRPRHLSSQTPCHPVHGRPHQLPTSDALGSPRRRVPLHRPLFRALPWAVRPWWCLSRRQRIHIG